MRVDGSRPSPHTSRGSHEHVLGRAASQVLDLGCGPGFYTSRLARLGHACVGVDFSPASVLHARSEAEKAALPCQYHDESRTAIERYFVITLQSGEVAHYASTTQAYSDDEYDELLRDAGFLRVERHASLSGGPADDDAGMPVLVARATDAA